MRFSATKFSTTLTGLLILGLPTDGSSMNSLKSKEIKQEDKMAIAREEVPAKDRWNVEALYLNPEQWKEDLRRNGGEAKKPKWPEVAQFKGKLHDPKAVANLFDIYLNLQRKLEKLHTYAHLRMDEDRGNDHFKSDFGLVSSLIHEFSLETSWIEPGFLSLSETQFQKLIADTNLSNYRFYLEKIGRMRS